MSAAPHDIASLLAQLGAGGAQPPTQDPGAAAPPAPQNPQHGHGHGDPLDMLRQMIQDAQAFIAVAPHEQDKAVVAQCLAQFQKLLATDEADQQGAMQGKVSPRQLARAAASQADPQGGPQGSGGY